jgi:hypothetical protein
MTSRSMPRWTLITLVMLCVSTCGSTEPSAPDGVFFPTVPIGNEYPAGEIEGMLELRSGCLFVARPEDRWLILWPEGYTAREVQGRIEILDEEGDLVAREGEQIHVGGGERNPLEIGGTAEAERYASEATGQDIPERCGDLYWLVAP